MRTRLNAILLIPVLVGLVMGGFQVKGSVDTWQEARNAERTALVVRAASEYSQAVLNERDLSAQPLLTGKGDAKIVGQVREATDAAKRRFDLAVQDMPRTKSLTRRLSLFRAVEPSLAAIRKSAFSVSVETPDKTGDHGGPVATEEAYVGIQHSLMEFSNELGLGTSNITSYGRTLYSIQLSKAAASLQRAIGTHLLVRPSANPRIRAGQTVSFTSYAYLEGVALQEYVSGGTAEDSSKLQAVMKKETAAGAAKLADFGQQAAAAGQKFTPPPSQEGSVLDGMVAAISTGANPEQLARLGVTPEVWMAASTAKFNGYTEIEKGLVDKAVTEAGQISGNARNDAIINGAIVVIALLVAFILAGMMARQMSRSMRSLRTAAFSIAEQRLPMLVDQLSRTDPGRVDTRVQPIPIDTRDEIGEVARAFDQVHREAVRLAAEQAMLRGNVNAIFTNLSRRNQSLIEGQLTLITGLENSESEPDQLESLFKLDHLATRMRRNGENLLVLAGEEPGRRWNQPVPLVDVLRAASSEVESYERIELTGVPDTDIHGQAVTDLIHLLAELLENATSFSSPQTKVRVTATRLPDGRVMVEIHDKGIGLTAEDFADINHKLANPPVVDAAVSQRMGLFVVGRLADRHGIRVQLRPSGEQAGTTSLVMLPDPITNGGGGEQHPTPDDFTVSQIMPDQPDQTDEQVYPAAAMLTAAQLGFDDSQYDSASANARQLDPISRTLHREERRAALGVQPAAEQPVFSDQVDGQFRGEDDNRYTGQDARYDQGAAQQVPTDHQGFAQQTPAGHQAAGYQEYVAPDGYRPPDAYRDAPQQGYPEAAGQPAPGTGAPYQNQNHYDTGSYQGEWADSGAYQGGYELDHRTALEPGHSAPGSTAGPADFGRPGPSPSSSHALTEAGLPRRGSGQPEQQDQQPAVQEGSPSDQGPPHTPAQRNGQPGDAPQTGAPGTDDRRSRNDDRFQRAEKLREPKAGGVTISGLPRRVPRANLVEGAAEQTSQGGPQVSRAPEDVRGRLSRLRRGVQRGRDAGTDPNGPGGSPGSTYHQER